MSCSMAELLRSAEELRKNNCDLEIIVAGVSDKPAGLSEDQLTWAEESLASMEALSLDSRQASKRCGFIAMRGEKLDGNDYVLHALEAGAPLIIMEREPRAAELEYAAKTKAVLLVGEDSACCVQELARQYRMNLPCVCVGITGSVGKTTTKEFMRLVASTSYKTHATRGNFNNELGLPLTILSAPQDCELLILEMGMSDLHEIELLCQIGMPHLGIITNVGVSHLGKLGSRENIARAKFELVENLHPHKDYPCCVALDAGDDYYSWMKIRIEDMNRAAANSAADKPATHKASVPIALLSHDRRAVHCQLDSLGRPSFELASYEDIFERSIPEKAAHHKDAAVHRIQLAVPGKHNIGNALAVLSIASQLSIDFDKAIRALEQKLPSSGRQDIIELGGLTIIDDSYNANPVSMLAGLKALLQMESQGMRYAVLGNMGELGEDECALHEEVGLKLVHELTTSQGSQEQFKLICIGDLAQHIAAGARRAGLSAASISCCDSCDEALELLNPQAGDLVFVKASRSAGLERVVKGLTERADW